MPDTTPEHVADPVVTLVDGFVPVIDMAATRTADLRRRTVAAKAVGRVCETSGFFAVVNHGMPTAVIDAARAATRAFFALPADQKARAAASPADPLLRGYGRMIEPDIRRDRGPDGDVLETFVANNLGEPIPAAQRSAAAGPAYYTPNKWPDLPDFRAAYGAYFEAAEDLAIEIMELFALALDLPVNWFADKFDAHMTSIAANQYQGRSAPPAHGELRKAPHTDWGTLTLLYKDETARGLQVLNSDRQWTDVPSLPGSLIVNIGDLMALWTNDRWASTVHRVVHLGDGTGYGSRQSLAFFHQPGYDALIACIPSCAGKDRPARHRPVTFGEYMSGKLRRAVIRQRLSLKAAGTRPGL